MIRKWAGWILAIAFVYWIALTFDWRGILRVLGQARPGLFLATSVATLLPYFFLRTLRWQALLPPKHRAVAFSDQFVTVSLAVGLGSLVPLQGTEILKVEAGHAGEGLDRRTGYAALILERGVDLAVVLAVFWATYPAFLPPQGRRIALALLAGVALLILLAPMLGRLPGTGRFASWGSRARALLWPPSRLLVLIVTTVLAWGFAMAGWFGVLLSLGIRLDVPALLGLFSGVTLLAVFSLIPGGFGICELGIAGLLAQSGVLPTLAQGAAILLRCYGLVSAALAVAMSLLHRRHRL